MKYIYFFVFSFFLFNLVSAQTVTTYDVSQDGVKVTHHFDYLSSLKLILPEDYNSLSVSTDYRLENIDSHQSIKIENKNNVSLSYFTKSLIDRYGGKFYFSSKNYLNSSQEVNLILPESAVLVKEGLIFPQGSELSSDGRRIILHWAEYNAEQIIVDYEFIKGKERFYFWISSFLVLSFIIYVLLKDRFFKKKRLLVQNLFGEEKKIVEYLLKKKKREAWTKEILKHLGISKVKLSRKLRNLEQKEVIKKIPYGNENKIRILKK